MEPQPSIYFLGLRIDEPVIATTDLLVATVSFYAYFKLSKLNRADRGFILFRLYFLFLGLATFWGAMVTHAFLYALSGPWKVPCETFEVSEDFGSLLGYQVWLLA